MKEATTTLTRAGSDKLETVQEVMHFRGTRIRPHHAQTFKERFE